jgi:hypothetical protein
MRVFITENCSCLVVKDGGMHRMMMIITMIVAIISMPCSNCKKRKAEEHSN